MLWLRQLSLIFGVTIYAASTVLATFMTGLAIGSAAAGRLSDRVRCPLLWFGATEALIGLTALVLPRALDLVTTGYLAVALIWSPARWRPTFAVALTLPREPADRQPDSPDPDRQDPSSGENVTPLRSRASVVRRRASSWRCCCTRNGCSPAAGCLRS